MSSPVTTLSRVAACTLMALSLAACAQTKAPSEISRNLQSLKDEVMLGRGTVVATTATLNRLKDSREANLRADYASYTAALDRLDAKSGGVGWVAAMSSADAQKYFKHWDEQIDQIQDRQLRDATAERREKVMAEAAKLRTMDADLRTVFRPYMALLGDIRTALGADLTSQGLSKTRPSIEKAIETEKEILVRVDAIVKQIDAMSN